MAEVKMDNVATDDLRKRFPPNDGSDKLEPEHINLDPIEDVSVERRPKTAAEKAKRSLAKRAFGDVLDYVGRKIIIPTLKDMFFDSVMGGLSMTMYGTDRHASRSSYSSKHTDYTKMSREPSSRTTLVREARPIERSSRDVRGVYVDDLIFKDRGMAYEVLDRLIAYIRNYRSVSVANLYQLCKKRTVPTDFEWGWYDLNESNAYVRRYGDRAILILPDPVPLTDDAPF